MDKNTESLTALDINGSGDKPRPGRGGLQKRFNTRIIESNMQPDVTGKVGNRGTTVSLESNFTRFSIVKSEVYYVYDTQFSKLSASLKFKIQFITSIMKENNLPGAFCFDGRRIFTSQKWGEEDMAEFSYDENKISIRKVSEVLPDTEEYYQIINILLNNLQIMLGQEKIGKGYFLGSNTTKTDVHGGSGPTFFEMDNFKVLGGFAASLQRGTGNDNKASVLISIERINRVVSENSVIKVYDRRSIDRLIGRDVITKHNNKTYRISDVKEMKTTEDISIGETTTTYAKYFKERYNINLQHDVQPFVLTKTKRVNRQVRKENGRFEEEEMTLSIPGELCFLCGFSEQEMANMDLQKGLAGVLKREPRDRLKDIPAFCDWISNKESAEIGDKWGIKIENKPIQIRGRELPPHTVESGNKKINVKDADDWKFGKVVFQIPAGAKHEVHVVIVDRRANMYDSFLNDVDFELKNSGAKARIGSVCNCAPNEITDCLSQIENRPDINTMALVFVPDDRAYAMVKSFTLQRGLLTQCVTTRNGSNKNEKRRRVVSSKTVMQMLAKFGYDPWTVPMKMKPTMIVGLDTYHSKTSKKSIQASVFSYNSAFSQYLSYVNSPKTRQEFHETLSNNFNEALKTFNKSYKILPARIIIFRDGVGDSQMEFTKKFEVTNTKTEIEKIYTEMGRDLPQVVYVVVKKRISTKFFNRGNNPNPGTVVDQDIVKPNFYEFFLVSQKTTKGTATPTNYNVLEDTHYKNKEGVMEQMQPNELQHVTYGLTHLYFNWMGTIRVPVPVHYAHRLAELVGKVHRGSNPAVINENIKNRLYYL